MSDAPVPAAKEAVKDPVQRELQRSAAPSSDPAASGPGASVARLAHLAGNSATAAYVQRSRSVPVQRIDPPGTTAPADPAADQTTSNDPGPLPGIAKGLLADQINAPRSKTLIDIGKYAKWELGRKSINVPILGLPIGGIALSASLDAHAAVSGSLHGEWIRAKGDKLPVQDRLRADSTLTATGGVEGTIGAAAFLGNDHIASVRLVVGGSAQLEGSGKATVIGAVSRESDVLAGQWGPWGGSVTAEIDLSGSLHIQGVADLQWNVLFVSGHKQIFKVGDLNLGTWTGKGTATFGSDGPPKFSFDKAFKTDTTPKTATLVSTQSPAGQDVDPSAVTKPAAAPTADPAPSTGGATSAPVDPESGL